jgi:ABC-type lipoprotein release transport system permease subunit
MAMCMGIIAFQDGVTEEMRRVMVHQRLGHVQVHHVDFPGRRSLHDALDNASARVDQLVSRSDVGAVTVRLMGQMLIGGPETSEGGEFIGVVPSLENAFTRIEEMVVDGRYLAEHAAHEVVLGEGLAGKIDVTVGDVIVVVTQSADGSMGNDVYTVVGLISTGSERIDELGGYMHLSDMQELLVLDDHAHEISLMTDATDEVELAQQIRDSTAADSAVVRTWEEVDPQTAKMIDTNESMNGIIVMIVLGVASIVVLNTMMMVVFERTREIGVLKALGMRPRRIIALILLEATSLTTLSTVVGLTLGGLLDWYLVTQGIRFLDGDLTFGGVRFSGHMYGLVHLQEIALIVAFAYFISLVAALWPAWRASRLDPVVAMRQD